MSRITENQLVLPTLYLLYSAENKTMLVTDLKRELKNVLRPSGEDLDILDGRSDTKFDQKVGNLHAHRTLEEAGYVTYQERQQGEPSGSFTLTDDGERHLNKYLNVEHLIVDNHNILVDEQTYQGNLAENEFSNAEDGSLEYPLKNVLFKGVPGTGKSRTIDNIIQFKLDLEKHHENILRINIHSASSNADLMQGIGITSEGGQIAYKEKQGLILDLIKRATYKPYQPFVLILEEIQENSLNELIGDLIYLIEPTKRANNIEPNNNRYCYEELVRIILEQDPETEYVEIPYLVENHTSYRKMIIPANLYVFCTSNYREDKKVIEDNLLRRFDVIEIFPQYTEGYKDTSLAIPNFLDKLNTCILVEFKHEVHPDRFQIGHSNWLPINENDEIEFYKAFLKMIIEFKEVREIEYKILQNIFSCIQKNIPETDKSWAEALFTGLDIEQGYGHLINELQSYVYRSTIFEIQN